MLAFLILCLGPSSCIDSYQLHQTRCLSCAWLLANAADVQAVLTAYCAIPRATLLQHLRYAGQQRGDQLRWHTMQHEYSAGAESKPYTAHCSLLAVLMQLLLCAGQQRGAQHSHRAASGGRKADLHLHGGES